ncbi:MAG: hypothetical protein B7Z13_01980 [Caulobacterales bacterium 32-67-6]|nr:MAG: hypothetical protein B7Z13_01980 [Caulobacterales bacterium 32-67-6]
MAKPELGDNRGASFVIRGHLATHGGLAYVETLSARAQRTRRRLTAVTAILSMACATALIGALSQTDEAVASAPPAPSPLHFIRI